MNNPAFPSRLFRWFIGQQIVISAVLLILLDLGLFLWLESREDLSSELVSFGREVILVSLICAFGAMVSISFVMARKLVIPLGRLIEKTRRLRKFPFQEEDYSYKELAFDEPGEWYDLERALNKLGRDLRQKTIRLSREKTELRAIMSAMNEAILAINVDHRPLFYNPQFAILFGIQGVDASQLTVGEMIRVPGVLDAYEHCLKTGESVRIDSGVQLAIDDSTQVFKVIVAPLKKKHNEEIYGAAAVFHDITEMKKAEQIRIDFVGNVSHELRTPLTSIKGYLQTVQQDIKAGRYQESETFLEIISKNVDRLRLLADDLLDLSSLESGQALQKKRVKTRELTEAVLSILAAKDHVIHLQFSVDEFEADAARVEQVLRNLLQNSLRYVPKGKNIWITWERDQEGHTLLRVKDDGPGIPKKHHSRLFERFYRIDEARSRELGGTGIGLSLVKHIMLSHGGSVSLKSEPGQGAEFICEFPS